MNFEKIKGEIDGICARGAGIMASHCPEEGRQEAFKKYHNFFRELLNSDAYLQSLQQKNKPDDMNGS